MQLESSNSKHFLKHSFKDSLTFALAFMEESQGDLDTMEEQITGQNQNSTVETPPTNSRPTGSVGHFFL